MTRPKVTPQERDFEENSVGVAPQARAREGHLLAAERLRGSLLSMPRRDSVADWRASSRNCRARRAHTANQPQLPRPTPPSCEPQYLRCAACDVDTRRCDSPAPACTYSRS
eukprot:5661539-Pleurochrysis_carterae.AAC.2